MRRLYAPGSIRASLALACLPIVLALAGCGGGGEDTGTAAPTASSSTTVAATPPKHPRQHRPRSAVQGPPAGAFHPRPHHDSGGGSAQFIIKGGDNSVEEFGQEVEPSELEAAATALHGFLDARAERNWAAACSYLSNATKQGFARLGSSSQPRSCAATLAALSGKVPTATLREAAVADVGSLRTEAKRGFLIYRGAPKGTVYAISVAREGGAWKVASLAGTPLN